MMEHFEEFKQEAVPIRAIPAFHVALAVPCQGRNLVARTDAKLVKRPETRFARPRSAA